MAFTLTTIRRSTFGNRRVVIADVDITSYVTGGEAITPQVLGLDSLDHVSATTNGTVGFQAQYNHGTFNKLRVFTGATQVANGINVGPVRIIAHGSV